MKPHVDNHSRNRTAGGIIAAAFHLIMLGLICSPLLQAAPMPPKKGKGKSLPPPPPPEMNRASSRFLPPEKQAQFVSNMSAKLSMSQRANDPFCRPQDPDAQPAIQPSATNTNTGVSVKATPFSEIVNRLKINTIMPGEKRFLIGERSFRQGEEMKLHYRMRPIRTRIESIKGSQIVFRNLDTDETAVLGVNLMPAGMQSGSGKFEAPGLFRDDKNAPINLDNP